ncbi:MarR family winged helix-turn-helix transcriptional regulator [Actinomycetospora cinnamomea]|uniref:DNA-binding MarR family transcriptional regulator n=1 Tax=Actinomycetospora cinnamomea TaxID=663609 RepID=A0A2U1F8P9_9PSEU|nr:MarR family transcriptional regulator [Actinomycetospora cinnamomea]PVZ08562.1 DNA-binding MarR family transcriptional regulator [Actinomycetospora cinnamomea]
MNEGPWLDDDEQRAWRRTAAVITLLPAALDAQLQRDAGLTQFSYLVLAMLSEEPGRTMPMSALAATVNSSLSRLSHVVARLEAQGWVTREPSPESGRVTVARLTDAGMEKVVATAPGHAAEVRRLIFDALDGDGVASLACVTAAILGRLDPSGALRANPLRHETGDRPTTA